MVALRRTILALVAVAIMAAMVVVTTAPAEALPSHPKIKACSKAQAAPPYCP